MDEPTFEQRISYLMQQVPLPVRTFILTELSDTALDLMVKHELHVDQGGVLQSELLLMLLGQIEPTEFAERLQESGVSPEVTRAILTDVNEDIFKKLREEERVAASTPIAHVQPQVPVMEIGNREAVPPNLPGQYIQPQAMSAAAPVQPPPPVYTAPPAPSSPPVSVNLLDRVPQSPVASPAYQAPASTPIYSNPQPVIQPIAPVQPYQPVARTMESDMRLVEQGFQPGFQSQAAPLNPSFVPPAPTFTAPAPMPPPQAPAPVLQRAEPVAPSYPPPVMASVRLTPVDRTHGDAPITKEYGSDPYREPIE